MLIGSITTLLSWMYKVGEWVVGGCNADPFWHSLLNTPFERSAIPFESYTRSFEDSTMPFESYARSFDGYTRPFDGSTMPFEVSARSFERSARAFDGSAMPFERSAIPLDGSASINHSWERNVTINHSLWSVIPFLSRADLNSIEIALNCYALGKKGNYNWFPFTFSAIMCYIYIYFR